MVHANPSNAERCRKIDVLQCSCAIRRHLRLCAPVVMVATPNCFYRMAHPMRKAVELAWWQCVRRYASYSALALCCIGGAATAGERYGQWSLDPQGEGII